MSKVKLSFEVLRGKLSAAYRKMMSSKLAVKLLGEYDCRLTSDGVDLTHASAKRLKRAQLISVVSLLLCLVFLLSMLVVFGKDVGPASIYNFFREVEHMGEIGQGEREQISYSLPTRNQSFAEFKRGFIVASDREIQVFNKAGYATMTEQLGYSDPQIVSSENTFLVYDLGGRGFAIYNSFEDIYIETREYPISAADMSGDGDVVIVGRSSKYNTELVLYDDEGNREFAYMRSDHTVDCKFSPNGKRVALLTLDAADGEYLYTLTVINTKNGEVVSDVTRTGSIPYDCYYLDGDRIALVLSDSLVIYNNKCQKVGEFEYPDAQLYRVAVRDKQVALMFTKDKVNMKNTVYIIDNGGEQKKEYDIYGEFSDMMLFSRYLYFATEDKVMRLDVGSLKLQSVQMNAVNGKIVVLDSSRIMLCRPNMSYIIDSWS